MYAEFAGDPVIQSLAFEDQRHYVVLLCLKCNGTLDRAVTAELRDRIVLRGLGLDPVSGSEAKRRLMEVGLIEPDWQPRGWDKRQYRSDLSTERVRQFRKRSVAVPETDQIQIQIQSRERTEESKATAPGASRRPPQNGKHITFDFSKGTFQGITEDDELRWQEAYPAVPIPPAISQAAAWLKANPANRKSNYERFLVNWFKRDQDKASRVKH